MKYLILAFALVTGGITSQATADEWPSYGVFDLDDYRTYFAPGSFNVLNVDNGMMGFETIQSYQIVEVDKTTLLSYSGAWVGVHENLLDDDVTFVKMQNDYHLQSIAWDQATKTFLVIATEEDFWEQKENKVWISDNQILKITENDTLYGTEGEYFDALSEKHPDCCYTNAQMLELFLGEARRQCYFIANPNYDVACKRRFLSTGEVRTYHYKRLTGETS